MATVRELMAADPLTVEPEESLRNAAELLTGAGVSGAPVVRAGRVVGVVTLMDILEFEADEEGSPTFRPDLVNPIYEGPNPGDESDVPEEQEPYSRWFVEMWEDAGADTLVRFETEGPEWSPLDEHTVSEVMSQRIVWVSPDTPLRSAAALMQKRRVHRLLVMEGEELVGILTAWDVVRAVAQGQVGGASEKAA